MTGPEAKAALNPALIDIEAALSPQDRELLLRHGWEIKRGGMEARLYSEEWSAVQIAAWSTKCWIEENRS